MSEDDFELVGALGPAVNEDGSGDFFAALARIRTRLEEAEDLYADASGEAADYRRTMDDMQAELEQVKRERAKAFATNAELNEQLKHDASVIATLERERDEARAEAERLKAEKRVMLFPTIKQLRTENERLRAALVEVVNTLGPNHFGGELRGLIEEGNEALRVARQALAEGDRG